MIKEEWRKVNIENFADYYLVSNIGNIYSLHSKRILKPKMSNRGYLRITLCGKNHTQKTMGVHRIVALTFIPNPKNKPTVNHKDECKTNNTVENLEWMTNAEQNAHGTRTERATRNTNYKARKINYSSIAQKHDYTKQNMCNRKKCIAYKDGVIVGEYLSQKDASEHTGVSKGKISSCLNGRIKSCKGYEFRRFPEREDE